MIAFASTLCFSAVAATKASRKETKPMMNIETQYGTIEIELFPKDAPKTVEQITGLIKKGFYNGLTFHRVVPGFVVQGGDPKGNGTGGSGKNIPAEFNSNKHVEGTVAMARSADPNSADSQFYISLGTHPHLDNQYTVFGKVVKGMDAVKKIKVGDKMTKVTTN
jgi:cyclophilin family peptidyl-prolyl cis-trans isomerase